MDIKRQAQKSTNLVITWLELMVWLSTTSQKSSRIKTMLEIDVFLE